MSYSLHTSGNGFLIDDIAGPESNHYPEPLLNHTPKYLGLHFSHDFCLYFFSFPVPNDMQKRLLLLKLPQFRQKQGRVKPLRQNHPVGHHRLQDRKETFFFRAKPFPRIGLRQTEHRTDIPCGHFLCGIVLFPGINADLMNFFLPFFRSAPASQRRFRPQRPARYF